MAHLEPACNDSEWQLLQKILLNLNIIAESPVIDPVTVEDEGITITSNLVKLNFTGAGVTATAVGDDVTVDIPGSAAGGDVVGPAAAVDNNIAVFDGVTGKLIKDSGVSISSLTTNSAFDARIPIAFSMQRITVGGGGSFVTFAHGVVPLGQTITIRYVQSLLESGATPLPTQIVRVHNVTTATTLVAANGNFVGTLVIPGGDEWYARFENNDAANCSVSASVHGFME